MTSVVDHTIEIYFTASPTDITSYAAGFSINRGRDRELDTVPAGTCRIDLRNYDGRFVPDDFAAGTPYTGNVLPNKRVVVTTESTVIFDGFIEGWYNEYNREQEVVSYIVCHDALGWLARTELDEHVTVDRQVAGERIASLVARSEVNWTGSTSFTGQGVSELQGNTVPQDANTLTECQRVATTDQGRFYASRTGVLTYIDRHSLVESATALTIADDGTGMPLDFGLLAYGSDLLRNRAAVTREGGATQTADDSTSQTAYGIRKISLSSTLHRDDSAAQDLASFLVVAYKDPQARVGPVRVTLDGMSTADIDDLCELDIGSKVAFVWTPRGSAEITGTFGVEGVRHVGDFESTHTLELALAPVLDFDFFTLDDATLGELDTGGILAY